MSTERPEQTEGFAPPDEDTEGRLSTANEDLTRDALEAGTDPCLQGPRLEGTAATNCAAHAGHEIQWSLGDSNP